MRTQNIFAFVPKLRICKPWEFISVDVIFRGWGYSPTIYCPMKKIVLVLLIGIIIMSLFPVSIAYADETVSSNVLTDLQKDQSFDPANYPVDNSDFSLYLFQIAETSDRELLVYVYQPSGTVKNLRATSLSMSLHINNFDDTIDPSLYYLEFLNR